MTAVSHRFVVMLALMLKRCIRCVARPRFWQKGASALLLSTLSISALPVASAAEWDPKPGQGFSQSEGISPARAAALVRSSYGGRVLSAAPASRGGSSGVVVRVLIDDGARVKTVFVDARGRMRAGR